MMNERVRGKTTFKAYAYRAYEPNFTKPAGRPRIPGPVIEATEGQTVAVHFQNDVGVPVTIHPHGIFYADEMDGAYRGKYTDPGGFVQPGRTFTYVWDARPGTAGSWIYHDHGPIDPVPVFKGLFGPLIIRAPDETPVDKEFCIAFHTFPPSRPSSTPSSHASTGAPMRGTRRISTPRSVTASGSASTRSTTSSTPSTSTGTAGPTRTAP